METHSISSTSRPVTGLFHEAVDLARRGNKPAARRVFARVTELDPSLGPAWRWRAHLAADSHERVEYLRQSLAVDPERTEIRLALHQALLSIAIEWAKTGARAEARRTLLEALELDAGSEVAWLWLASLALDRDEKRAYLDRVLEIDPHHSRALEWKSQLAARPTGAGAPTPTAPRTPTAPQVLVIDDSITVRSLVSRTLERRGYRVWGAATAEAALDELHRFAPDLVFLDIELPNMDGFELCQRLKSDPGLKGVPVVMLSGKDGVLDKFRGKRVGASGYITKPFSSSDLLEAAQEHCG